MGGGGGGGRGERESPTSTRFDGKASSRRPATRCSLVLREVKGREGEGGRARERGEREGEREGGREGGRETERGTQGVGEGVRGNE